MNQACKECGVEQDKAYLHKCPMCHQLVCEEHKMQRSGRVFCSVHCADLLFHEDEDEIEPE